MREKLLAIDAGTGSVRAVLFDADGNQLGCVQREWTHAQDPRYPGSMDFDCERNWALLCECTRGVLAETGVDPHDIAAVSSACMREGIVLYDRAGTEIWACANVDSRAADEVGRLKAISDGLEEELYRESGQTFALGALPRLLWVKDKLPDIYEKTAAVGMINDWILYRLSDSLRVEPSNGSTTGIFNLKTRRWDTSIAERCDLRSDIFPATAECGDVIGAVSKQGAADSGLAEGTPLVAGGGDCQLATIGLGVAGAGQAAVIGGSFWQYEYNTAECLVSPACDVRVNCHAIPGLWQYEALAFNPGLVVRWYRDAFCAEEARRGGYAALDAEAAKIPPGSGGMVCAFSDEMRYINWRHAAPSFINFALDATQFNKYTFYRAILENACLVTRAHLELVRNFAGANPSRVTFAGGAAKSPLWARILSDTLNLSVAVPVVKEATALGAAILAGAGVGLYADVQSAASKLARIEAVYDPEPSNVAAYKEAFDRWRAVYPAQLDLANRKITRPMWSAPGL